jgi:tetratricopeptide (TPR) repeat protein
MKAARNRVMLAMALVFACLVLFSCSRNPQKAKAKYLAQGQNYMKKGQYGDAAIEFRNALRIDPRFVDAYYQLAQANLAQHNWNAGYASLVKAIELDPTRLDARLDRGRLYLAARQFGDAESEANYVLKQQPSDVNAYQILGAALMGEQKPDQALAAFAKVAEFRPNDPSSYINMALIEISLRRLGEAEQNLKRAVAVDPKSVQAYTDLAGFYRLQNRLPEAQAILQQGTANTPNATPLYIEWASMLTAQGKSDEAETVLAQLRKALPNSSDAAMAIGDFYFDRKQTDRALVEYRRGLSADPKNLNIKKRMQDLYLTTGQMALASDLDKELMKDAPKDVFVRIDHGRLLIGQQNSQDAINFLQGVVADAADSPQAHFYLAMAFWQHGELGQTHGALMDALKASQGFPPALQALARLSLEQGNSLDAQTYAQEVVQRAPADPNARLLFAETLARQGKLRPAEEQVVIASRLAPNESRIHGNLAQIYSAEKKWPEAQKEFDLALQIDPHNTTALAQLADFLKARNQSSQALARVQQYVAASPNDANGHLILGLVNLESKNFSTSQTEFERAIQIDPNNIQAFVGLGKVFESQGQTDLAIARYQTALDLQPKSPVLATTVGNLYLTRGDNETARKYFAQALASDPNFAPAMANTAWVDALESKDLDIALGLAQKAKSLAPEVPSITDTLAWVLYRRGAYESAMPLLREAVQKAPDSAEYHYHLGMTLVALGQKAKGKEELEVALRLKQDSASEQQVRQALAQLN